MVNFLSVSIAILATIPLTSMAEALPLEKVNQSFLDASSEQSLNNQVFLSANGDTQDHIVPNSSSLLLNERLKLIEQLEDSQVKTEMLIQLALEYYQNNDKVTALNLLDEAVESSKKIKNKSSQILSLLKIADIYLELEQQETALNILDDALIVAQEMTKKPEKATLLIALANKYEQMGKLEQSVMLLEEVEILIAEIENPPPSFPFQPLPLTAKVRTGTNFASAQNTLLNFTLAIDASKQWTRDQLDVYFKFLNSYDDSRETNDENRITFDVITQYKYYYVERQYLFGNLSYVQDDFSGNEKRFSYFTGLGFNVWQKPSDARSLTMQIGLGDLVRNSNIRNANANFPVAQYAVIYRNLFFTDWKFRQSFILEVPISNTANYFADSQTVLTIPAINNWSIFGNLHFKYLGIPQVDAPNLSTSFTAGLEYEF